MISKPAAADHPIVQIFAKRWKLAAICGVAYLLIGCQSPRMRPPVAGSTATRNNCYSLLHQLLAEQKEVSLLRFIKSEDSAVKKLVNRIAMTSGTAAKLLEEFAKDDPSIRLDDLRLPPGELAARDAIASTKEKELLSQSGNEFQLSLLLTQTEALSYASHLARVGSEHEPQPAHAQALAGIGEDMQNLNHEVFILLLAKTQF